MEIKVMKIPLQEKEKVVVECHEMTSQVQTIVKFIKSIRETITGVYDDREYEISIQDIFYVESVDNKTFIYTKDKVYSVRERLYEIEDLLSELSFLRISKSVVVNLLKIKSIKPALNGRFGAILTNGEEVIISRKYVSVLKEKVRGGKKK